MWNNYHGITHLFPITLLPLWKKMLCNKNWHLFDEVESGDDHYLVCDACDLVVNIESIDKTFMEE